MCNKFEVVCDGEAVMERSSKMSNSRRDSYSMRIKASSFGFSPAIAFVQHWRQGNNLDHDEARCSVLPWHYWSGNVIRNVV